MARVFFWNFKFSRSFKSFSYMISRVYIIKRQNVLLKLLSLKNFNFNISSFSNMKHSIGTTSSMISGLGIYLYFNPVKLNFSPVYALEKSELKNRFNFIADVVEEVADAVVSIESHSWTTRLGGSGFIVDSKGLIITCAHVVGNQSGKFVTVVMKNGKTFKGKVIDVDLHTDLALISIEGNNLPALKLCSAKNIRPGEWVAAIGSPLNLSDTVTTGVVSSTHRNAYEFGLRNRDVHYIQTDAFITFGNSGGPLINLDGEVIGVNVMTAQPGISFAVSIPYVEQLLKRTTYKKSIEDSGKQQVYIGGSFVTLTPKILNAISAHDQLHIPNFIKSGVLIYFVIPGSPAHLAGLQGGDIVYQVNEKMVETIYDLLEVFQTNDSAVFKILRKDSLMEVKVTADRK